MWVVSAVLFAEWDSAHTGNRKSLMARKKPHLIGFLAMQIYNWLLPSIFLFLISSCVIFYQRHIIEFGFLGWGKKKMAFLYLKKILWQAFGSAELFFKMVRSKNCKMTPWKTGFTFVNWSCSVFPAFDKQKGYHWKSNA